MPIFAISFAAFALRFDISRFLQFRYMTCRFGRISREYYNKFETYVYGSEETLFYPCQKNDRYIWGFYFCPTKVTDRIDAVYASMHFEQLDVPEKLYGIPFCRFISKDGSTAWHPE